MVLHLVFDRRRAHKQQDYRTVPTVLLPAHRLSEDRGRNREQTNSWVRSQVEDYRLLGPNAHRSVQEEHGQGVAPGRSLPAAIPRRTPRFRGRTAVAVRASLDVVGVVFARAVLHAARVGDVRGLVEVLRELGDDVDSKFEVEMQSPKALSHLGICDSNCPLQLDQMVRSSRDFRLLTLAMANAPQCRLNLPRPCKT